MPTKKVLLRPDQLHRIGPLDRRLIKVPIRQRWLSSCILIVLARGRPWMRLRKYLKTDRHLFRLMPFLSFLLRFKAAGRNHPCSKNVVLFPELLPLLILEERKATYSVRRLLVTSSSSTPKEKLYFQVGLPTDVAKSGLIASGRRLNPHLRVLTISNMHRHTGALYFRG